MANWTITLKTQAVNVFGPAPSQLWGGFSFGVGTWGYKAAGAAGLPPLIKNITKVASGQAFTPTDVLALCPFKVLSLQTLSFSTDCSPSQILLNGIYDYVFPGPTIQNDTRTITTYASSSANSATWATPAQSATTWS